MINIAELLKDAPKGMKLYSPLLGEVEFAEVMDTGYMPIRVMKRGYGFRFDKYGRYMGNEYPDSECLLFPSKDCRTWKGWKSPVKHKFEVGDWVTDGTCKVKIADINNTYYWYSKNCILGEIESIDKNYHLWTIEDAKDGDILVTTKVRSCPFIYRKTSYNNNLAYYYAGIDGNGNFCEGCLKRTLFHFGSVENVVPATKEQRDLLFAKIKEAGYQWDVDKKELRKIQPHYDIANFQPFDKVLTRDTEYGNWNVNLFSYYIGDIDARIVARFRCINSIWIQCIPFNEETKHLLGTTDMCDEQYINW